ncbi:hypothetical protein FXV77_15975 [Sphingobacterium phlebotomi]|uniref:HMA domain-containing protein n=1 Tax=Sphingobacterium phlebotomi TaxID=2605433 RepID=A0A5D4H0N4_9SPHI|nr:hypothetical protein [Sphingobacterium phlebotomi]TYR34117.1 hypothetical protein FXV77_15975 [Sphingobacterium phlebotomi]
MENFKFEALVTEDSQLRKLEDCIKKIPNISDWQITKHLNGILLSVKAANIRAFDIVLTLQEEGFSLERLYEE